MTLGTVQQLYRYPVKSMAGEAIRTAVLGRLGIEGDRAWALRDEQTGHWTGRRVRVGGAVLEITTDCPRCVMATVGFADLPKDPKVMRTIVAEAGGSLGVYANVLEPGTVSVGDTLAWAD